MAFAELSLPNEQLAEAETKLVEKWTPERINTVARGLGRAQIIGRHPNGLPITQRALDIAELMQINEAKHQALEGGLNG